MEINDSHKEVDRISFLEKEPDQWLSLLSSAIPRFKQIRKVAPAQAVGLLPGFEMSARDLAHLYSRLTDIKPEVIEALRRPAEPTRRPKDGKVIHLSRKSFGS